jgi:type IV pilus assembly protein PilC
VAYQYIAYNTKGALVKGRLSVDDDKAAGEMLNYAGYQIVSLKPYVPFFDKDKLADSLYKVKTAEVILFYRQLATLLEAGSNIASSVEMLLDQSSNPLLKKVLRQVVSDIRGGTQLSVALAKHTKVFAPTYCQVLGIGEKSGELEKLLRQVADYMEKEAAAAKQTKSALMMPGITAVVAVIVVGILITFVLPAFGKMYSSLGAELPPLAKAFLSLGDQIRKNGLFVLLGLLAAAAGVILYVKTPRGRYQLDKMLLRLPLMGRIRLLSELARYCRSMSLLFHAGMPLSDVMPQLIRSSSNKVLAEALTEVQNDMIKGEGLSGPMAKNKVFLPMMVQMVKVGEEAGSLDVTLQAVAQSYEAEAADKIHSLIELIQPTMTLVIGGVVGLIAVTLMSAMTSIYGKL